MLDETYADLSKLALGRSGQEIPRAKSYLMEARLAPIARREGFASLDDLAHCLRERQNPVFEDEVVAALTSKETRFFRDRVLFEQIANIILPRRLKDSSNGKLRIWCAGGASGQEAYSLLMAVEDGPASLKGARIEVLSTDICKASTDRARAGEYGHFEVQRGLSIHRLLSHFTKVENGDWKISESLRAKLSIRQQNLLEDFSGLGKFDLILCRNVLSGMIPAARKDVATRMAAQLLPGGMVLLGMDENLSAVSDAFERSNTFRSAWVTAGTAEREASAA